MKKVIYVLFSFVFTFLSAQSKLKLNLDPSGQTYVKGYIRGQAWARYLENNPGSSIGDEAVNNTFDISIRRLRMGVSAQVTSKLYFYSVFGGNNINQKSGKNFQFQLLDLLMEYEFAPEFALGFGKSGWMGLSRANVRSSKSLMSLDAPLFSLLTVNKNDTSGRMLGAYAKGQIGKWDYVVSINNPYNFGVKPTEGKVDFADNRQRTRSSAYVKYEFWDNESNKSPYSGGLGSHVGKQKLLNVGGGFLYQPKMMSQLVDGKEEFYDFKNWSAEVFMDKPLNPKKGDAITAYFGYFDTDYGPNYIRIVAPNNIAGGGSTFNESGDGFPMMGTGKTVFMQLGYLFPKEFLNIKTGQFQPNIAIQASDFEALDDWMTVMDLGINYYIKGHDNKLTLSYQSRPIFEEQNNAIQKTGRKGMLVLQYQLEIN